MASQRRRALSSCKTVIEEVRLQRSPNLGSERGVGMGRTAGAKARRRTVGIFQEGVVTWIDKIPELMKNGVRRSSKVSCVMLGSSGFIYRILGSLLQD